MVTKTIRVTDPLQPGYCYELQAPEGTEFAENFTPDLTPKEMLALGVFGGTYFEGEIQEYPSTWFTKAKIAVSGQYDKNLNYFGVKASQRREEWQKKGWIYGEDPRGWFQWYCRYYLGRRIPGEDTRQIVRWKNMVRHLSQITYHCRKGDMLCRPRQRQALLHWAYNTTVR